MTQSFEVIDAQGRRVDGPFETRVAAFAKRDERVMAGDAMYSTRPVVDRDEAILALNALSGAPGAHLYTIGAQVGDSTRRLEFDVGASNRSQAARRVIAAGGEVCDVNMVG